MGRFLGKYFEIFSKSKFVLLINITDRLYSFIILLFLAREFSSAQYGEVISLLTLAMIIQIVFDFGIPAYVQREIASGERDNSEFLSLGIIFTVLLFPLYFVFSYILKQLLYPHIDIILFVVIFIFMYEASIVNICNKALSGKSEFRLQFYSLLFSRVYIFLMFIVGIYFVSMDLLQLMLIILTGFFLNLVLAFRNLGKKGIGLKLSIIRLSKLKAMLISAIPLGAAVMFNLMYDKIDVLLLSVLKDFEQVGYYNVGYGLYKGASVGFSFLLVSGFTFVSSVSKDKIAVSEFFYRHLKVISVICLAVALILFIFSGAIVDILYTERYSDASIVVKVLAAGFVGLGLNNLTGVTLNGMGFFKIVMYITLYGLVINILLNIFFIPLYGIIAASVISVSTEYFIFFTQYHYLRKIFAA